MAISLGAGYQARTITYLGPFETGSWNVKMYGVSSRDDRPPQELIEAAKRVAETALPAESDSHLAFCIAHESGEHCYVLVDWWANENEIHQRMFSAPLAELDRLAPHPSEAIGCVWELAVTDFERRAWLRDILANPEGPDEDAYLQASFNGRV